MRWKERDYLCYVWKCQSYSFCVSQEIPLWILKKQNFVDEIENSVCKRLIDEFLLFQYSRVYISVKKWGILGQALAR